MRYIYAVTYHHDGVKYTESAKIRFIGVITSIVGVIF